MVNEKIANTDIRLHVNYDDRKKASELGARWDKNLHTWYAPKGSNINDFSNFMFDHGRVIVLRDTSLNIPYSDKEKAKELGCFWNADKKTWQVFAGADIQNIPSKYFQEEKQIDTNKITFKEFATEKGLIIDELIPDGEIHRVAVDGGKPGTKDGAYIYHDDENGKVGWLQNFKTGETASYGEGGATITKINAKIKEDIVARKDERIKGYDEVAKKAQYLISDVFKRATVHPYLAKKGVEPHGVKIDNSGGLIIPLSNIDDKIRSFQKIDSEGNKIYIKGGEKSGNFFQFAAVKDKVIICEGFATGASIYEATKIPVVAAMDSSNLDKVAVAVREKYGDKISITIAADNDHLSKVNTGIKAAENAAKLSGATVVVPNFNDQEKVAKMTDFNDLSISRGKDVVKQQIFEQNKRLSIEKNKEIER